MGVGDERIASIPQQADEQLAVAQLTAPLTGTITRRHITRGEVVTTQSDAFLVADLDHVWVMLTVYPRDLPAIEPGQRVTLRSPGLEPMDATIDYVSPTVEEETRTATARVVLTNPQGHWRPGLFVTGVIEMGSGPAGGAKAGIGGVIDGEAPARAGELPGVVVPRSALQEIEGQIAVFVQDGEGFEPRFVKVGDEDANRVRIVSGLAPGDRYVARNAFTLKAELDRGLLEHAGHAH